MLLTYDAYRAHISVPVLQLFRDHNIIAHALLAHSNGKLQPWELVVFGAFKRGLRYAANDCVAMHEGASLDIFGLFVLLGHEFQKSFR